MLWCLCFIILPHVVKVQPGEAWVNPPQLHPQSRHISWGVFGYNVLALQQFCSEKPKGPTLRGIYGLNNQWVTWVGTRSKFFPSILLMCFLAWDVIWCLSRKENWQPSRMQWKWLFTWLYLQPTDTKPLYITDYSVHRFKKWAWAAV